jgi:hypothetical protein
LYHKTYTWIHSSSLVTKFLHKLNHLMMVRKRTETCSGVKDDKFHYLSVCYIKIVVLPYGKVVPVLN